MTFLEICRAAMLESGDADPITLQGVRGASDADSGEYSAANSRIVSLTRQAWLQIQMEKLFTGNGNSWGFLIEKIRGVAKKGQELYSLQDKNLNLDANKGFDSYIIADRLTDSDGSAYPYIWNIFNAKGESLGALLRGRGAPAGFLEPGFDPAGSSPLSVTLSDDGETLIFDPRPDQDYFFTGYYLRAPQSLQNDNDVPIISEQFHSAIVWKTVAMIHRADEAERSARYALDQYETYFMAMCRRYLPGLPENVVG